MLKKFIEGLVFGSGFAISFVGIWYLAALLVWPAMVGSKMEEVVARQFSEHAPNIPPSKSSTTDAENYGDGVVIFFVGSPASMRLSMTYSGDRIHSLGDLPVELLRKKCNEPSA